MTSRIAIFEFLNFANCNFKLCIWVVLRRSILSFGLLFLKIFNPHKIWARKTFKSLLNLKSFKRFQIM